MHRSDPSILTINAGSSSITFARFQVVKTLERGLHGQVDWSGADATLTFSDQRLNSIDASPLRERDRDPSAAKFLVDWVREAPEYAWVSESTAMASAEDARRRDGLARSPARTGAAPGLPVRPMDDSEAKLTVLDTLPDRRPDTSALGETLAPERHASFHPWSRTEPR